MFVISWTRKWQDGENCYVVVKRRGVFPATNLERLTAKDWGICAHVCVVSSHIMNIARPVLEGGVTLCNA